MSNVQLLIKKDHFFTKIKAITLVWENRQTREQFSVELDKHTLIMMPGMVESMSGYHHDDFYISKHGEDENGIILEVIPVGARIGQFNAYVYQKDFLEMVDGLFLQLA